MLKLRTGKQQLRAAPCFLSPLAELRGRSSRKWKCLWLVSARGWLAEEVARAAHEAAVLLSCPHGREAHKWFLALVLAYTADLQFC